MTAKARGDVEYTPSPRASTQHTDGGNSHTNLCRVLFVGFFLVQLLNAFVPSRTPVRYAFDAVAFLALPMLILVLAWVTRPALLDILRKEVKLSFVAAMYALFLGLILALILLTASAYQYLLRPLLYAQFGSITLDGYAPNVFRSFNGKLIAWFLLGTLPAFAEEIFYRTVLIQGFRKPPSQLAYVVISTILFTIAHFEQGLALMTVYATLFGVPLAIYYSQERRIGPLLVIHATVDLLTSIGIFFFQ